MRYSLLIVFFGLVVSGIGLILTIVESQSVTESKIEPQASSLPSFSNASQNAEMENVYWLGVQYGQARFQLMRDDLPKKDRLYWQGVAENSKRYVNEQETTND